MNQLIEMAAAHLRSGQLKEAEAACRRLLIEDPASPTGHILLGQVQKRLGNVKDAIECFSSALAINENAFGYVELAELQIREGLHVEAEKRLRRALELQYNLGLAHELLGIVLEETGRFPEAMRAFVNAYDLQPGKTSILYRMSRCKRMTEADLPFVERLEQLRSSTGLKDEQIRYLDYALGKAYDDLSEFEKAMSFYDEANRLSERIQFAGKPYPLAEFRAEFERIKRCFTEAKLSRDNGAVASDSERPIFIVGMLRSGTTLVEQILSSHPEIAAGGELPFWLDASAKNTLRSVISGEQDVVELAKLNRRYLEVLQEKSGPEARVTDKMPNNYMALGLVHLLFPNARIIHCRRNPIDNCLSIYTTVFSDPPKFAYSKENIAAAYSLYADLMAHWFKVIPEDLLLTIDYEDLIDNRETVTRRMIEFCGLEWDDSCLHHESNPRTVSTPSLWQVRQPLYRSSVERWKNYKPWLGALDRLKADHP